MSWGGTRGGTGPVPAFACRGGTALPFVPGGFAVVTSPRRVTRPLLAHALRRRPTRFLFHPQRRASSASDNWYAHPAERGARRSPPPPRTAGLAERCRCPCHYR